MVVALAERVREQRVRADLSGIVDKVAAGAIVGPDASSDEQAAAGTIAQAGRALLDGDARTARAMLAGLNLVQLPTLVHSEAMGVLAGAFEAGGDLQSYAFVLESLLDDALFEKNPALVSHLGMDLVSSYVRLGQVEPALEVARATLQRLGGQRPDGTTAHAELVTTLTELLAERGELREAHDLAYGLLADLDPDNPAIRGLAHWSAATVHAAAGQWDEAATHSIAAAHELAPTLADKDLARVWLLVAQSKVSQSTPDLAGAVEALATAESRWQRPLTETDRGALDLTHARVHLAAGVLPLALDRAVRAVAALSGTSSTDLCLAYLVLADVYERWEVPQAREDCLLRASQMLVELPPSSASTFVWRQLSDRMTHTSVDRQPRT